MVNYPWHWRTICKSSSQLKAGTIDQTRALNILKPTLFRNKCKEIQNKKKIEAFGKFINLAVVFFLKPRSVYLFQENPNPSPETETGRKSSPKSFSKCSD
jgi:hypothetical protein